MQLSDISVEGVGREHPQQLTDEVGEHDLVLDDRLDPARSPREVPAVMPADRPTTAHRAYHTSRESGANGAKKRVEGGSEATRANLPEITRYFVNSPELQNTYDDLDDPGFVELLYGDVLDLKGEPVGMAFWNKELDNGMAREWVTATSPSRSTSST